MRQTGKTSIIGTGIDALLPTLDAYYLYFGTRIEKDCTNWAHGRLKELLPQVATDLLAVKSVPSVTGEVSVNVRKGKIRQIFDLTMELECEHQERTIKAKVIDFMSNTELKDFEFSLYDPQVESAQKEALKLAIWDKLREFMHEVEQLHGKSLLVDTPAENGSDQGTKEKFNGVFLDDVKDNKDGTKEEIKQTVTIRAPVEAVWSCLTDPGKMMMWTRGTAQVGSMEPGASFSLLSGNVLGTVTDLTPGKALKMEWRLKHWSNAKPSLVELRLEASSEGTRLVLKQTGIPASEVESVKENWHRYYWEPIKTILGCSSTIY